MHDFIIRVLAAVAAHEQQEDLHWRTDGKYAPVSFWINCNDVFWWGTGDGERITPDNVAELEKAYADAEAASQYGSCYGGQLFCARVRGLRPQGAAYPDDETLWPLFDACGPERPKDICNPFKPGYRKVKQAV